MGNQVMRQFFSLFANDAEDRVRQSGLEGEDKAKATRCNRIDVLRSGAK